MLETENREWNKQLRLQATALVNARLAKQIGLEDYAANRLRARVDAAECRRRAALLQGELVNRISEPLGDKRKQGPKGGASAPQGAPEAALARFESVLKW
jgi:hypothetical protein